MYILSKQPTRGSMTLWRSLPLHYTIAAIRGMIIFDSTTQPIMYMIAKTIPYSKIVHIMA